VSATRIGAALALLAALGACSSEWPRLEQPGAGFVVALPDSATCGSRRDDSPAGAFVGRYCSADLSRAFFDRLFPIRFEVSWSALPAGFDAADPARADAVLRELATRGLPKGSTTTERIVDLGGLPAREFDSLLPMNDAWSGNLTLRERLVVRAGRLYRVGVWGAMGSTSERAWTRLLASFRFTADTR
jgi:hypothetical protein